MATRNDDTNKSAKKSAAKPAASTRKMRGAVRSGTTTAGKTKKAGSGGLASSMKNKQVNPSKATVAAGGSEGGKPSRKSTRRGANRVKQATQLTGRTKRAVRSPKARAGRSSAERARPRG